MPHAKRSTATLGWLISLINPPPLRTMTRVQKVARVFVFTMVLLMICILSSMLAAAGIFILQHASHMFSGFSELIGDLGIIFFSMVVNALCVMVLLKIKAADQSLIPPKETPPASKPE